MAVTHKATMKCPHCLQGVHVDKLQNFICRDNEGGWGVLSCHCPLCGRIILELINGCNIVSATSGAEVTGAQRTVRAMASSTTETFLAGAERSWLIYPRSVSRSPVPPEVPNDVSCDYLEACQVLPDSPKASAALSRRCLQHLLRTQAGVKSGNLADEIQQVLNSNKLPSYLAESLDAVRNIGNFAAHTQKSINTGAILDVEPDEAEWTLNVLESLFEFYFVQPARLKTKRDALNKKLADAGKPPMK